MLELRGFPQDKPAEEIQYKILEKLKREFNDQILAVYVVPDYTDSYQAYLDLNEAKDKLRYYQVKYEKSLSSHREKRPMIRKHLFARQIDAINHFEKLIQKHQSKYQTSIPNAKTANTGFAYLMCKTPSSAQHIKKNFQRSIDELNSFMWFVHTAPAPHEIKWENMRHNFLVIRGKRILLLIFFIFLFFVWVTPTGFLKFTNDLISDFTARFYFSSIFSQYLPTLILLTYQNVILYYSINYIVSHEKRTSLTMETISRFEKYLIFMAFYVFILQALGLQTIMQISIHGF